MKKDEYRIEPPRHNPHAKKPERRWFISILKNGATIAGITGISKENVQNRADDLVELWEKSDNENN